MSLTIEQILGASDQTCHKVECPEWGGHVFIRTLSADERDAWEMGLEKGNKSVRASLVGLSLSDEDGKALSPTPAQIKALGQKGAGPMDRIFDAVLQFNSMRKSDMEKLEKNSE